MEIMRQECLVVPEYNPTQTPQDVPTENQDEHRADHGYVYRPLGSSESPCTLQTLQLLCEFVQSVFRSALVCAHVPLTDGWGKQVGDHCQWHGQDEGDSTHRKSDFV